MKKLTLSAGLLLAAGICMTSCKKDQSVVAELGNANVTLNLTVNNDQTNDTIYDGSSKIQRENVPTGTAVQFFLDGRDLQSDTKQFQGSYTYNDVVVVGTVDANGNVTAELPADANGVSVTVKFPDLELEEKMNDVSGLTGEDTVLTETKIYTKGNETFTIYEGATIMKEFNY